MDPSRVGSAGRKRLALAQADSGTIVSGDGLVHLMELQSLRSLTLGATSEGRTEFEASAVGDEGLEHLGNLNQLEELQLAGTKLTDEGMRSLGDLRNLRSLDISGTGVTDAGLSYAERMPNLRRLVLDSADRSSPRGITERGVANLRAARPDLEIFHVGLRIAVPSRVTVPSIDN